MAVVSHRREEDLPLIGALRRLRDPLLLFVLPGRVRAASVVVRATGLVADRLRLPRDALGACARAAGRGTRSIREPTRDAMVIGNPAVYPPLFIVAPCRSRCSGRGRVVALVLRAWRRVWSGRCGSLGCGIGAATCSLSRRPSSSTGCTTGTSRSCCVAPVALAWRYRERARSRASRLARNRGEVVRVAPRRLAAPDPAFPGCGVGVGVGGRAGDRRVGADRVRGAPRLSRAPERRTGRLRRAQHLRLDRGRCTRRAR